jgi:hypothetical protein
MGKKKNLKNKKGVIFTVTTAMFMVVLIIFAVYVYQTQEKGQEKVISNSIATQIIDIEDSVKDTVSKIYKTIFDLSISINTSLYPDNLEVIEINTSLSEKGYSLSEIQSYFSFIETVLKNNFQGVYFNSSKFLTDLTVQRCCGYGIKKTALNISSGENQTFLLYYNMSGRNNLRFDGITILIDTSEEVRSLVNSTIKPPNGGGQYWLNFTINDINYDPLDIFPLDPNIFEDISFSQINYPNSYSWHLINESSDIIYMNITMDYEKLNLTVLQGDFNVSIKLYSEQSPDLPFFRFPSDILYINLPYTNSKKVSSFSLN